ncbi:hypothetical protein [Aquimarina celericrescens]|uniref:Uncharacterized protein n=1 Tax=Aquimarina celericrescens TaxID=1964542 RepID=A0ABW5AYK6_9FLAO|nr:hypothetical protein [Aquimarina celericrescens]
MRPALFMAVGIHVLQLEPIALLDAEMITIGVSILVLAMQDALYSKLSGNK